MKESELRRIILKNHAKIRDIMISEPQMEIIKMSRSGLKASTLSKKRMVSIQAASTMLNKIFHKGYLMRSQVIAPSCDYEFIYRPCSY